MEKEYKKYRWFFTSSDNLVIGGKSAEQNEEIMRRYSESREEYVVMHTSAPGSPFTLIKNPNKRDLEEMAIFTAGFSQQWKKGKVDAEVDIFTIGQISKDKKMKTGTFGVAGKIQRKKVKLELSLDFQKGKLRAVPKLAVKKSFVILTPGNLSKEQAVEKLIKIIRDKFTYIMSKDEIMAAIPAKDIDIKVLK
jgi:hypothetical protein